jgi:hypothetical protein
MTLTACGTDAAETNAVSVRGTGLRIGTLWATAATVKVSFVLVLNAIRARGSGYTLSVSSDRYLM